MYLCWCGRRPSKLRKLLVLVVSLSVIFWVSLLGHQQRQSLLLSEQVEPQVLNSGNFDTSSKGKNTPRVLMDANNGRVLNHLISNDHVKENISVVKVKPAEDKKAVLAVNRTADVDHVHEHLEPDGNSSNTTLQQVVAISKHEAPLASDSVHLDPIPSQKGPDSLQLLHQHLRTLNHKQRILNADKFPPLSNDGLVLIVQVHKRENYLKQLFESLKKAKGIESVLLVISHDYYYDDMNAMVASVDFCRVSSCQLVI